MSIWTLLQIVFNLSVFVTIAVLWMRLRRPPQDDPRLSRGLQLLQTKITVLEDLSDRTDSQVKTLTTLLDQKNRLLQNKILEAEQQMLKIDHSMHKSMEVAEIFQDKIPHQEILERQRTVEYVKAARMANSGLSVEQIAESVHLPREQIELIAKFNREQLMFDESSLPEWATKEIENAADDNSFSLSNMDFVNNQEKPAPDFDQINRIASDFKQAVKTAKEAEANPPPGLMDSKVAETLRASVNSGVQSMQPAVMSMKATAQTLREKLMSTAEDLLRSQNGPGAAAPNAGGANYGAGAMSNPAGANGGTHIIRQDVLSNRATSPEIKKVIFPRIEK